MQALDGYIRVSSVRGREGESFISPSVQRDSIEAWAANRGYAIAEIHEDLDQSGGKADRPGLAAALARCESGATGGIIVSKLDRLSRSIADAANIIRRLDACDAELVSVADGFDSTTPVGRFARTMMLAMAELELDRVRAGWVTARGRAVARGIHITAKPPSGYSRRKDGRLEPNEQAPAIREAFLMRAKGIPLSVIGAALEARGATPGTGGQHWTLQALGMMLANPVYTGQARSGEMVNDDAHEAIISRRELAAALAARTVRAPNRQEPRVREPLLMGLARCAGCRYALRSGARNTRDKSPGAELVYRCRRKHPNGACPAPVSILCDKLDVAVWETFYATLSVSEGYVTDGGGEAPEEAVRAVRDAEWELDEFVRIVSAGEDGFRAGLTARQDALEAARKTQRDAERVGGRHVFTADQRADLMGVFTPQRFLAVMPAVARQLLNEALDCVVVWKDGGARLVWRGDAPDDLPRRGAINVVKPFE